MTDIVAIRRALISVSDKAGLVPFARALAERGVEILSTGGSAKALREAGVKVTEVSDHTGFPEIMDGRVKTLVPQIHGGILGRRDVPEHMDQMREHGIAPIDLVAVNLYPFEATVAKGSAYDECVENIDIGGPALIRGAAKARFSDQLVAAARARDPAMPQAQLDKLRGRLQHVPLVIAVSARLRDNPKVPEVEQLLSSGASVMNLLNALHAQGFGAIFLTGPSAYDPAVAAALGYGVGERLLGFVYVGTVGSVVPTAPARPARADFVSEF